MPTNSVRYDSPSFGGFSVSASWGEDDFWDVAARYAGEWADFKVAAAAAYSQTNSTSGDSANVLQAPDSGYFQVGAYVEHIPTGLFVYGAYGRVNYFGFNSGIDAESTYYGKGGIRQRWNPLGHTVLYGEYEHGENNAQDFDISSGLVSGSGPTNDGATFSGTSTVRLWGVGVVQEIDAAAMSLWVKYRNIKADYNANSLSDVGSFSSDSFQEVTAGALINF